jgi:hypothetical protein
MSGHDNGNNVDLTATVDEDGNKLDEMAINWHRLDQGFRLGFIYILFKSTTNPKNLNLLIR